MNQMVIERDVGHDTEGCQQPVILGKTINAETALSWGLIAEIVPTGQARTRGLEVAREFIAHTEAHTLAIAKRLLINGGDVRRASGRYPEYLADKSQLSSDALNDAAGRFAGGKEIAKS